MAKPDVRAELDQASIACRCGGLKADPEAFCRSPYQQRFTDRIGRGDQHEPPGFGGQGLELTSEILLDLTRQRGRAREPESARQLRRLTRKLQQPQRIPARLTDDPIPNTRIQRSREDRIKQRLRIRLT
jgi:hypothetical protein